ncbi:tRNA (adenosine(37)-N6)-threonylcarbamoyltransferase complex ATPase subunit type 1 TsaE [Streptomyces sp. NPDC006733]|uniref:tRNA (adenosine(37)-N6)-threonylcarbamoyltransferase complex ATPase subunit type 1 TsaE n=1 Tax=Streptomyces sp. NPDC006733 TaxID=3155460 RepID=UPI0033F8E06A
MEPLHGQHTADDSVSVRLTVRTPDRMQELGRALAALLLPGDLVLLSGELGAGKTTLTRGLGEGLGVRGAVTSPTFVIARVHPSLSGGPALVHVDAYRLAGGLDEMEDLDLDVSLPESVVVVEWGEGKVEELSEARLQVVISRTLGDAYDTAVAGPDTDSADPDADSDAYDDADSEADDVREVTVTGIGPRWVNQDLSPLGA